ncbi:MAG: family 78 glycoside hydrolase catalytic domain [Thermoleophilia bacterium]|nr:family 78 glycoside hydrolase catalytic domain [Thermoleophilia bacterium]
MELLVNGLRGLVVTDDRRPTISFRLMNTERLDAVRLTVEDSAGELLWDTGERPFEGAHVRYQGAALPPKTVFAVTATGFWCGMAVARCGTLFETGFMGTAWAAGWIEPEQEPAIREKEVALYDLFTPHDDDFGGHGRLRPCRELVRTFTCAGRPTRARLYATAHGVYETHVNGRKAGDNLLAPETSSYQERLYYQTYDVTGLLREGENQIAVTLADGWWIGRIGLSGDSCQFGDKLGFLMQLEWTDENGATHKVCSDESFRSRRSYVDYADLFMGEHHDYVTPCAEWGPVASAAYDMNNLIAQPTAPVVEWERLDPERFFAAPNGNLIVDFGKCLAGVAELTVRVAKRTEVVLDFSEVLDSQGDFFCNIMGRNKDQRDGFVCGEGVTTFRPRFTYHGFRYVRIAGVTRGQIVSIHACALGTRLDSTGRFTCSDERLNALQRNIRQSERSNMFSVPTDCPQREKMGWTGDILAFAKTGCFNFDLHNFLSAWLGNMRVEQREDGEIPNVVPTLPAQDRMERAVSGDNTSSAWGDACVLVPHDLYRCYGDTRVLRDNLPMMERWLGFIAAAAARKPEDWESLTPAQRARNPYLWTKGHHFGDWLIPSFAQEADGVMSGVAATREVVGACYYAVTVRAFLRVLDALLEEDPDEGLRRKRAHFDALLPKIKQAVREEFIADDGHIRGDLMGMYVMALYADIAEGTLKERLAERLVSMVEENGYRLDTGFVSTPHLLDVLTDIGHKDVAYRLLFQTESPSWLYMVENGATTIWENWEAIKPDGTVITSSFNHYALGSVGEWIYGNIGGIRIGQPGYRHIVFSPDPHCGLAHADCSVETPYGKASCSWKREAEGVSVEIMVPAQATAELRLDGEVRELSGGLHSVVIGSR